MDFLGYKLFLRNLLLDERNELHNRSMDISGIFEEVDIESIKVDIGNYIVITLCGSTRFKNEFM